MAHLPFMLFYPADWIRDTQILSLEAQGAWMKILCALHFASERGRVTLGTHRWKQYLGYPDDDRALNLLGELTYVAEIECRDSDGNICDLAESAEITVTSNRMIRDEAQRVQELERKRRYEVKRPTRTRRVPDKNTTPILHTSEVRDQKSDLKIKNPKPAKPAPSADASTKPKNLDPKIKEVADRIYASDPKKFARLIVWIRQAEQQQFGAMVIAAALKRFEPYAKSVELWYPYLDKLIYKTQADLNIGQHDARHTEQKQLEKETAKMFSLKGVVKDA